MTNHFHLLVETPLGNLPEFMRHFNITYIGYFNRRHKRVGNSIMADIKAILVDKEAFGTIPIHHLNPVRIKALEKTEPREKHKRLKSYPWSSLSGYDYGGDTDKSRKLYRKALVDEMIHGKGISDQRIGQSVIGGEKLIAWVKETYLSEESDGEVPAHRAIKWHGSKEGIIQSTFRRRERRSR